MKYYLETKGKQLYTQKLLSYLAIKNGHQMVPSAGDSDAILISLCDITEVVNLIACRAAHPEKTIIAGGHLSHNAFVLMGLYADIVWLGHGFEFFKLKSIAEIKNSTHAWQESKKSKVDICQKIDWQDVPVIQIDKRGFSYWGAVGCKNKCAFCLTSWTNKHQKNSTARIQGAIAKAKKKGAIKIISNEYESGEAIDGQRVQDMMLKDFIQKKFDKKPVIRAGIEFATDKTRKENGKPITSDMIRKAIEHAKEQGVKLFLFFIGGMDSLKDWEQLFDEVVPDDTAMKPVIYLKFTNLEYQQGTPLYKKRHEIKLENYLDGSFTTNLFRRLNARNKRIRTYPVKYPAHAIWRTGISLCVTKEQADAMMKLKNCKNHATVFTKIEQLRLFDTDYQKMGYIDYREGHK